MDSQPPPHTTPKPTLTLEIEDMDEEYYENDEPLVFQPVQSPSITRISIGSECSKRIKTPIAYK